MGRAAIAPVWTYPQEGRIGAVLSSPTVYHGVAYVATMDSRLYAIHATGAAAGKLLPGFPITLDGPVRGRPAVYGNAGQERVYVATSNGSLYAFGLDGRPAWQQNPQPLCPGVAINTTPAVRGPYVYVTAANGRIFRRNAWNGSAAGRLTYGRAVTTRLAHRQAAPPARTFLEVADASAFFPAGRITVAEVNPVGDSVTYEYTYSGCNTAVQPNRLLNVTPVGSGSPMLAHPKGSLVTGYGPGAECTSSPAVPGRDEADLVIAALDTGNAGPGAQGAGRNLVGLKSDVFGFVPQWEASFGERITTNPVVDEKTGSVFVGSWNARNNASAGGRMFRLHASTGQADGAWGQNGSVAISSGVPAASPWLDRNRGILYFGTTDGTLYALSAADGSPVFPPARLDNAAGAFAATPLLVGNRLYIGGHSGRFYSVPVDAPGSFESYADPDGEPLDSSASASGSVPGTDVVVVGSAAGKVLAFPVIP